jgi:hypothetical protein
MNNFFLNATILVLPQQQVVMLLCQLLALPHEFHFDAADSVGRGCIAIQLIERFIIAISCEIFSKHCFIDSL